MKFIAAALLAFATSAFADPTPDLPNRVEVVTGYGQDGLTYQRSPDGQKLQVSPYMGPLLGARYSRTERLGAMSVEVLGGQSGSYVVAFGLGRNF